MRLQNSKIWEIRSFFVVQLKYLVYIAFLCYSFQTSRYQQKMPNEYGLRNSCSSDLHSHLSLAGVLALIFTAYSVPLEGYIKIPRCYLHLLRCLVPAPLTGTRFVWLFARYILLRWLVFRMFLILFKVLLTFTCTQTLRVREQGRIKIGFDDYEGMSPLVVFINVNSVYLWVWCCILSLFTVLTSLSLSKIVDPLCIPPISPASSTLAIFRHIRTNLTATEPGSFASRKR